MLCCASCHVHYCLLQCKQCVLCCSRFVEYWLCPGCSVGQHTGYVTDAERETYTHVLIKTRWLSCTGRQTLVNCASTVICSATSPLMHKLYANPIFTKLIKLSGKRFHYCCCCSRGHFACVLCSDTIFAELYKLAEDTGHGNSSSNSSSNYSNCNIDRSNKNGCWYCCYCCWCCCCYRFSFSMTIAIALALSCASIVISATKRHPTHMWCSGPIFAELNKLAEDSDLHLYLCWCYWC